MPELHPAGPSFVLSGVEIARKASGRHAPAVIERVVDRVRGNVIWIGVYFALVFAPLLILILGPMPLGTAFWWDLSMALGFGAIAMLGVQFALTARFKRASSPFGIDIIYLFHRYLAIIAVGLALAHFGILWWSYEEALGSLNPLVARWELTSARVALVFFVLAVVTSEWRKLLRLEYGLWRYAHVFFACTGFIAAVAHIVGVGYYTEAPGKRSFWLLATVSWLLVIVWVRLVKPWSQIRHPYRVAEVQAEAGDVWTVAIEPEGHSGLKSFMPGQFAWITLRNSPFALREHPFSIVSGPSALPRIEFSIKALGDFTNSIRDVRPGERVYLDGPYGVFSIDRQPDAAGFVGIVGGIGITPCMSMIRAMADRGDKRPFWLFAGNPTLEEVVFREELDELVRRMNLTVVHVIQNPNDDWQGEKGFLTREILERYLPEAQRAQFHYFLCGPPPMIDAAEKFIRELGVPQERVQVEIFDLV
jgi:predicted ferric reductase